MSNILLINKKDELFEYIECTDLVALDTYVKETLISKNVFKMTEEEWNDIAEDFQSFTYIQSFTGKVNFINSLCIKASYKISKVLSTDGLSIYLDTEKEATPGLLYTKAADPETQQEVMIITGYSGRDSFIYIPDTYEGLKITAIDDKVFIDNKTVKYVRLPKYISNIGASAFQNCINLKQILNADNLKDIGMDAFSGCSSLESINMPSVTYIDDSAFEDCVALTYVNTPELKYIGTNAFYCCESLAHIDLFNVLEIGDMPFYSCTSLTTVNAPNLTYTGGSAFADCFYLKTVYMPRLDSLGEYAFVNCLNLTEVYLENVKVINLAAFQCCTSLKYIKLACCHTLCGNTFEGCSGLQIVEISLVSTENLLEKAFLDCENLQTIVLSCQAGGPNIEASTFEGCTKLKTIYYTGTQESWESYKINPEHLPEDINIYFEQYLPIIDFRGLD